MAIVTFESLSLILFIVLLSFGFRNLLLISSRIDFSEHLHFLHSVDISKAHSQLTAWLKRGMVPTLNAEPTISHGLFDLVDLNLLRNPQGFVCSIRYAKAVQLGVTTEKV